MPPRLITLLTSLTFVVLAATGVLAFTQAFSIRIVGLHALMGFVFVALVGFHVSNNFWSLKNHLRSRALWTGLILTTALTTLLWWQPTPVKMIMGLSANLGPALDRFELNEDGMRYQYSPSPEYKLSLDLRTGGTYDPEHPPYLAVWLENASFYHIKTLYASEREDRDAMLPYWSFKVAGWEQAKQDAENGEIVPQDELDGVSGATQNSSFDPSDYILKGNAETSMPYRVMIEINQTGDASAKLKDQPALIFQVEVDNVDPRTFQLLELVGYPVENTAEDGGKEWDIYYVDETFDSALDLIDSALLRIDRAE